MAIVPAVSLQAAIINVTKKDGTVNFNSADDTNGYWAAGDDNYIAANLASYDALGSDVTIRVTVDV